MTATTGIERVLLTGDKRDGILAGTISAETQRDQRRTRGQQVRFTAPSFKVPVRLVRVRAKLNFSDFFPLSEVLPMSEGSITTTIADLREGTVDPEFWNDCFAKIAEFARKRLSGKFRAVTDEEDIASSVLRTFFRRVADGQYDVATRNELWRLFWVIADRKVKKKFRDEMTRKRGQGNTVTEADLVAAGVDMNIDQIVQERPEFIPEVGAEVADLIDHLIALLSESQQRIARLYLDGLTPAEIKTEQDDMSIHAIRRTIRMIRKRWEETLA